MPDYIADDYVAIAKAMEQLKFEEHQNEYEITLATASASVNLDKLMNELKNQKVTNTGEFSGTFT